MNNINITVLGAICYDLVLFGNKVLKSKSEIKNFFFYKFSIILNPSFSVPDW
jgi:hypothetical protein